jgi:hypothetical protein
MSKQGQNRYRNRNAKQGQQTGSACQTGAVTEPNRVITYNQAQTGANVKIRLNDIQINV